MYSRLMLLASIALSFGALTSATSAQQNCVQYHLIPKTVYEKRPVTRYRWVNETQYETKRYTEQVPVYSTEKRERVTVSYKPVVKTSTREEEYSVLKPVTETKYRERTYQETEYETVTEMRDREYVVEKPVTETRYREERVLVRKPVRKTEMRTQDVTTYRPVQTVESQLVPGAVVSNQWVQAPGSNRSHLDWVRRGYYWDAQQGRYIFRRAGFHWTNPGTVLQNQTTIAPVLVPQQRTQTSYLAETSRRQTPVEVLQYDEHIEVRKIPVEVETTQRRVEVRKVPVEIQRPVTRTKTERVPYEETRMERVTRVRRVPVEETTWQRVEEVEPYEKVTARWVEKTREVRVPKTVARRVAYEVMENVPRTVWMKVPVDAFGNVVGNPIPIETRVAASRPAQTELRETTRRVPTEARGSSVLESKTLNETSSRQSDLPRQRIQYDRPARPKPTSSRTPDDSIIVPESVPTADNSETPLVQISRRPVIEDEEPEATQGSERPTRLQPVPIKGDFEPAGSERGTESDTEPDDQLDEESIENMDPQITGGF